MRLQGLFSTLLTLYHPMWTISTLTLDLSFEVSKLASFSIISHNCASLPAFPNIHSFLSLFVHLTSKAGVGNLGPFPARQ